jgi:hypothetical protein
VFAHWLYLPDDRALLAVLGTVAANRLDGDPVWLVLVGPPGGGKSEILQSTGGLDDVHPVATLTEPALLSGTAKKERDMAAKGGLLRVIGEFGIVLCKDFTSVLSMHRDGRAQVMAALREIYDGSWTRHLGVDGGRTLHWEGKVGLIAGCTPSIDRHHAVMGAMGERFVLFRLSPVDSAEQAHRALAHVGAEKQMRAELSTAVSRLFGGGLADAPPLRTDDRERLVALASFVVCCRSAVERDSYSREIELIPEAEAPTRLVVVLARLLAGLDAIGVDRAEAWSVVVKAGLDSIPAIRREILNALGQVDQVDTSRVSHAVGYPTQTTRRALEDLTAHRITERHTAGKGHADNWSLSTFASRHYAAFIDTVPEKSDSTRKRGVPEKSDHPRSLFTSPFPIEDDISGTVANGQFADAVRRYSGPERDPGCFETELQQ